MPFKSEKQRKWMHANEPEMAKKWEKEEQKEAVQVNIDKVLKNPKIKQLMKRLGIKQAQSYKAAMKILNYLARNPHALAAIKIAFESVKEERDYKAEYKKYGSSTKAKKYRAELNQYNRKKGTYGNGDGKDASHKGGKIVGFEKESTNRGRAEKSRLKKEAISKEEWAQYPKYARKLKPYLQKLFKVPIKVRVIKQANHNPWIEVRVARFGKDIIPNDFRVKAAKAIGASGVRDWDNVNYGNIRVNSISLKTDVWRKLLGNKVKESVNEAFVNNLKQAMSYINTDTKDGKEFMKLMKQKSYTKQQGIRAMTLAMRGSAIHGAGPGGVSQFTMHIAKNVKGLK